MAIVASASVEVSNLGFRVAAGRGPWVSRGSSTS